MPSILMTFYEVIKVGKRSEVLNHNFALCFTDKDAHLSASTFVRAILLTGHCSLGTLAAAIDQIQQLTGLFSDLDVRPPFSQPPFGFGQPVSFEVEVRQGIETIHVGRFQSQGFLHGRSASDSRCRACKSTPRLYWILERNVEVGPVRRLVLLRHRIFSEETPPKSLTHTADSHLCQCQGELVNSIILFL